ncbi:unnamed protein product [Lupinus luteus]|uniref:Major facilitator superfamily (MFS) profile domain-containing protein n=1 Tax=Lupinus luteus TaxID=3873 RepID=A0AAV1YHV5_LUPLU
MGEENVREPLLKKRYYENCPGCKVDQAKELNPRLSIRNILIVWMVVLSAGSSLMLGRALTSVLWGLIADRYGRKPVLLIGAYASELFREEHQSIGISTVSAAWGIGLIIGPALGGYLAQETLHNHNDGKSTYEVEALENEGGDTDKDKIIQKKENLLLNWPLMSAILIYSFYSLQDIAFQEVFSLWAVSPRRFGGINFTSDDVGLALIIYQAAAYPLMERSFGMEQHQRGEANGIAMTFVSMFKAIGPATGGAM